MAWLNNNWHFLITQPRVAGYLENAVLQVTTLLWIQPEGGKWPSPRPTGVISTSSVLAGKAVPPRALGGPWHLLGEDFEKRDARPLWAAQHRGLCNGPEKVNWTLHFRDKGWDFIPENLVTPINLCPQTV